jgi:hypothetical protein
MRGILLFLKHEIVNGERILPLILLSHAPLSHVRVTSHHLYR